MSRPKEFDQDEVLLKAMQIFWAKGYAATSLNDLVHAMEINRQSIYNTFGDKHALFMLCLDLYWQQEIGRVYDGIDAKTAEGRLRQMMHGIANLVNEHGQIGCLMVNALGELAPQDEELTRYFKETIEMITQKMANRIQAGQQSEELHDSFQAETAARFLIALSMGLRILGKICPSGFDFQEVADFSIDLLKKNQHRR
jgi:TetR/AcrR family transcriptional regulator, transcriptional repressor for nem operon